VVIGIWGGEEVAVQDGLAGQSIERKGGEDPRMGEAYYMKRKGKGRRGQKESPISSIVNYPLGHREGGACPVPRNSIPHTGRREKAGP